MKTKTIILLGAAALVTLSFTFANVGTKASTTLNQTQTAKAEPAGGFGGDEIVK